MKRPMKLVGALLIAGSSLALAGVKTETLNSDPSAQMAYEASASFDGAQGLAGKASPVGITATRSVVASHTSQPQKPQSASVPSREERAKSEKEKLDKLFVKGATMSGMGWVMGVVGSLAQWPLLAGVGIMTLGLGIGFLGAVMLQEKEMSEAGKIVGSGILTTSLGTVLLGAAIMGAPAVVGLIGASLFVGGLLFGLVGGLAAALSH